MSPGMRATCIYTRGLINKTTNAHEFGPVERHDNVMAGWTFLDISVFVSTTCRHFLARGASFCFLEMARGGRGNSAITNSCRLSATNLLVFSI